MTDNVKYTRRGVSISVEQIEGFGKNPSLWIGTEEPNRIVKVASFGSVVKARLFIKWLDYILKATDSKEGVTWDD